ncbi:AAA family ATPase [Oryzobacter terrae]|uniref:AAA family ATPase n=1 Tax=Oryzobacter terrae TaxID=1620385 RepID=UPI00366AC9C0
MRLHRLEVEAFGPFAGRVSLDLDTLSSAGLFLVHGPTGAGKTSLLDAVCFALYADVPGARSKRGLRSDHAAPGAVPTVRLELTVGGRRLRIERSPEFLRPKKRGEGSLRVQARVVLEERRAGTWVALSTRNDEVADLVKDVVGLGLAQFSRVVLLPQGDFATFLRATPEERREVLERLFDITVFSDVEAWLAETRRTSGSALEAARRELTSELARLEDALTGVAASGPAAGVDPDLDGPEASDDAPALSETPVAAVPARLAEVATDLGTRLTAALAEVDAAEGADRLAQEALLEATRVADLRRRGDRAAALLDELDASEPRHLEHVATLDAATRATSLSGHLSAVHRATTDVERAAGALRSRLSALASTAPEVEAEAATAADLAARVHALDPAVTALSAAARTAADLDQRLTKALAQRDRADATVATATSALDAAEPELATLAAEVQRLASATERVPGLEAALATHEERRRAHDALDADLVALEAHRPALLAARDAVLGHQDVLLDLRQRRLDGMAAELAAALPDDAPCPVCGAVDHPHPATPTGGVVTPAQVTDAEVVLDAARARLAVVEARATALEAAAETRREGLGDQTREQVEADLAAAVLALAAAGAEQDRAREAATRLEDLRTRTDALATARDGARATSAALTEQLAELADEAAGVAAAAERAVLDHADCPCGSADPTHHTAVATALDALARAADEHAAATRRREVAASDLDESLAAAGFADATAALDATLPAAELEALRRRVAEHDEARVAAGAVLDDPEVSKARSLEPPDVAAAHDAARTARQAAVSTATEREVLTRAVRVLATLRPTLEATCAHVAALEERHARVRELADTAGGLGPDNTLKMRLTSFVLAARLEKVAELANERLRVMGGGRYVLEHTDERAAGGARSGLGLRVLDQWTGRSRETTTLSGGESFMASLALALGLADAVKEEAGGHDLATLFVDEGFGSLDDDSLEEVLTVLDGLREGGRAVGVVSHVADLRARVTHQVVVRKGTDGSTVEVRTGATATATEPAA